MSEVIGKVKCRVCENEDNSFCKVKQCTVRTNKARHCKAFIMNESKIKVKLKPKSVERPDWYWNRKQVIKDLKKEAIREQQAKEIDAQNGNTKWMDATYLEVKQIDEYNTFTDKGRDYRPGSEYKKI